MQNIDPELINSLIRERRSVKPSQFAEGKKIPDEVIRQVLLNATWAPNHGHTEPWYFLVYTGDGLKKLADFQSEFYKEHAGEKFTEAKYHKLKTDPLRCSHVLAITLRRKSDSKIPLVEEIAAVACSVENIYLSLSAYGFGGYWSTGGVTYYPGAKSFFGLGDDDLLLGFFSMGHIEKFPEAGKRKPLEQVSEWIRD